MPQNMQVFVLKNECLHMLVFTSANSQTQGAQGENHQLVGFHNHVATSMVVAAGNTTTTCIFTGSSCDTFLDQNFEL